MGDVTKLGNSWQGGCQLVGLPRERRGETENGGKTSLRQRTRAKAAGISPDTHWILFQALSEGFTLPSYLRPQALPVFVGEDKGMPSIGHQSVKHPCPPNLRSPFPTLAGRVWCIALFLAPCFLRVLQRPKPPWPCCFPSPAPKSTYFYFPFPSSPLWTQELFFIFCPYFLLSQVAIPHRTKSSHLLIALL